MYMVGVDSPLINFILLNLISVCEFIFILYTIEGAILLLGILSNSVYNKLQYFLCCASSKEHN